jgi:hypothetical protein
LTGEDAKLMLLKKLETSERLEHQSGDPTNNYNKSNVYGELSNEFGKQKCSILNTFFT